MINSALKILLIILTVLTLEVVPALAQEASPSANLPPDIKSKLQALQVEIASKAAQIKQQVSKQLSNRAYIGTIKDITDSKMILTTASGEKSIILNQDTNYFSRSYLTNKKIAFSSLSIGDFVAALGDLDESQVLTAQSVIKSKPSKASKKVLWGKVEQIFDSTLSLKDRDNQTFNVTVDDNTNFQSGNNSSSFSKITPGSTLIVSGLDDGDNGIQASFIYLFPKPPNNLIKNSQASASATKLSI